MAKDPRLRYGRGSFRSQLLDKFPLPEQQCPRHVRYSPKPDIHQRDLHVRFVPLDGVIGRRACG